MHESCSPGKYGAFPDQPNETEACDICESGYFCGGGAHREGCPKGTYNNVTQQINISSCIYCSKGKYGNTTNQFIESDSCIICEKGYYCTGSTHREACPIGTYNNETNQHNINQSCITCEAGKYGILVAQTNETEACHICDGGYFCAGGAHREGCPKGTYNNVTQQSNISACINCSKGKYGNTTNQFIESD